MAFIENLPPEIERRLQVEEAWARRCVLCDVTNAERLDIYRARRALVHSEDVIPQVVSSGGKYAPAAKMQALGPAPGRIEPVAGERRHRER